MAPARSWQDGNRSTCRITLNLPAAAFQQMEDLCEQLNVRPAAVIAMALARLHPMFKVEPLYKGRRKIKVKNKKSNGAAQQ